MDLRNSLHVGFVLYSQVLTRSDLCDMIILASDGEVHCHSSIVAIRSERMRSYLTMSTVNRRKLIFALRTTTSGPILAILKYIYTGDRNFGTFTLDVMKIAGIFECNELLIPIAPVPALTQKPFIVKPEPQVHECSSDDCETKKEFEVSTHVALHRVIRLSKPSANEELRKLQARRDLQKISKDKIKELRRYCFQCDKTFATVGSCTRHFKMIHFKMKPLACYVCGHSFFQKSDLKKHLIRTHKEDMVMTSAKLNYIS